MSMSKLNTRSISWNGTVTAGISSAAVRLKRVGPSTARCRRPSYPAATSPMTKSTSGTTWVGPYDDTRSSSPGTPFTAIDMVSSPRTGSSWSGTRRRRATGPATSSASCPSGAGPTRRPRAPGSPSRAWSPTAPWCRPRSAPGRPGRSSRRRPAGRPRPTFDRALYGADEDGVLDLVAMTDESRRHPGRHRAQPDGRHARPAARRRRGPAGRGRPADAGLPDQRDRGLRAPRDVGAHRDGAGAADAASTWQGRAG